MEEQKIAKALLETTDKPEGEAFSPLALAYIGDAVFELLVRTRTISSANMQVNKMHKRSRELVNATRQAHMYFDIFDLLDEEEQSVIRRGRNAKSASAAKNASLSDYRHATGLEALFGYLYLNEKTDRIFELFKICIGEVNK